MLVFDHQPADITIAKWIHIHLEELNNIVK